MYCPKCATQMRQLQFINSNPWHCDSCDSSNATIKIGDVEIKVGDRKVTGYGGFVDHWESYITGVWISDFNIKSMKKNRSTTREFDVYAFQNRSDGRTQVWIEEDQIQQIPDRPVGEYLLKRGTDVWFEDPSGRQDT